MSVERRRRLAGVRMIAWRWFRSMQRLASRLRLGRRIPLLRRAYWRINSSLKPTEVRVRGGWLRVHPQDFVVADALREHGEYEPLASRLIESLLPSSGTFLDVGANLGYHSVVAAGVLAHDGTIVAVEPDPDNLTLLRHNLAHRARCHVHVIAAAASDADGDLDLYVATENLGDHRTWPVDGRVVRRIPARRLDGVLRDLRVEPDMIKIDVQGFEHRVLGGLEASLRSEQPTALLIELWSDGLRDAGGSDIEVVERLVSCGFDLFVVDEGRGRVEPVTPKAVLSSKRDTNLLGLRGVALPSWAAQ